MSKPKLLIEVSDIEQARYIFFRGDNIVIVEGQVIDTFDDLVVLCSQVPYKDREYLKVQLLPVVGGG